MPNKVYYKITEVEALLDVPQSTLRWWEREIDSLEPIRTPGGQRRYTAADIETIRKIKTLVYERGLSIEAVSDFLKKTAPKDYRLYCKDSKDALNYLAQLRRFIPDNTHGLNLIEAIEKYLKRQNLL